MAIPVALIASAAAQGGNSASNVATAAIDGAAKVAAQGMHEETERGKVVAGTIASITASVSDAAARIVAASNKHHAAKA